MDDMEITQAVLELFERDCEFFETTRQEMADETINITGHYKQSGRALEWALLMGDFGKDAQHAINEYKEELAEKCQWARKEVVYRLKEIRAQNYIDSNLD